MRRREWATMRKGRIVRARAARAGGGQEECKHIAKFATYAIQRKRTKAASKVARCMRLAVLGAEVGQLPPGLLDVNLHAPERELSPLRGGGEGRGEE